MRQRTPTLPLFLAVIGVGICLAGPSAGQSRSDDLRALGQMLALVPDTVGVRQAPIVVDYVDYRAIEAAVGAPSPGSLEVLDSLSAGQFKAWSRALSRVEFDPLDLANALPGEALARAVPYTTSGLRGYPGALGIEWFAIDRALAIGGPPARGTVLGGGDRLTDLRSIAPVLRGRDFEVQSMNGTLVWHRFDDREIRAKAMDGPDDLGFRNTDPFGIQSGHAARIAALPGALAGSRDWALIADIVGAADGTTRSLADNSAYRAAAAAITDDGRYGGMLVRALFTERQFTAGSVSRNKLGSSAGEGQREVFAEVLESRLKSELPPYRLAVMADRQEGPNEVALVALVYGTRDEAEAAAAAVSSRVGDYAPLLQKVPLADAFSLSIGSHVYQAPGGGPAVAVITMSEPVKPEERPGRLFRTLQTGFFFLEPEFLIVSAQ
ncbi:MAG: hypothetical protein HKM95_10075 [Inquilinus sp.]|nr:hypothetical protein [Inquilinus sp.]